MIRVTQMKIEPNEEPETRRFTFPLRVSRNIRLTDNKLVLEYPLKFNEINNIGEAVVFSLFPIAYQENSFIELPESLAIEQETQERIDKICELWNRWFLCNRRVKVIGETVETVKPECQERFGAQLFSGGVDSMATFRRQKAHIKYLIFYNGADIRLTRPQRFQEVKSYIEQFAQRYDKEIIAITTNIHYLHPVSWEHVSHSCAMLGPALALSNYVKKVFIASSFSGEHGKKMSWGSHPDLDPLIRSNHIETIHDGFGLKRTEKIVLLSEEPELLKHIRVCGANINKKYNCGKCEKCYRTIMILSILSADSQNLPFPKESFSLGAIANFLSNNEFKEYTKLFWSENLEFLELVTKPLEGKDKLIRALKKMLGHFYFDYKNGFPKGLPKAFEYASKWRKLEAYMRLKPESLLWIKKKLNTCFQSCNITNNLRRS
ncbi:MAG: hypothetical protein JSW40_09600 [Candidatus Omnitrophota bacterium]|nr:MAG: hypothetical protein JSW40_09600 [Candidatus Omnitrophota bacterium]